MKLVLYHPYFGTAIGQKFVYMRPKKGYQWILAAVIHNQTHNQILTLLRAKNVLYVTAVHFAVLTLTVHVEDHSYNKTKQNKINCREVLPKPDAQFRNGPCKNCHISGVK